MFGSFGEDSNATAINGDQNNELAPGAGAVFAFTDSSICGFSLAAESVTSAAAGGTGTIHVLTSPGCAWTAASNASWLEIISGSSGTGTGEVRVQVAANTTGFQRTGNLTVAGSTFTVYQSANGECFYSIGPGGAISTGVLGQTGAITVNAAPGCAWIASTSADWIVIQGPSGGSGAGSVQYSVLPNFGQQRAGVLTIAGEILAVTQFGIRTGTQDNALLLPQVAGGGTEWHTTLFVTNLSTTAETFTIRFYGDAGSALAMPVEGRGYVDSIADTVAPGQTRRYETFASPTLSAGWALLTPGSTGTSRLSGQAVFRQTVPAGQGTRSSEAAVDFLGIHDFKFAVLYDNAAGFTTAVMLANPSDFNMVHVEAAILDEQGNVLSSGAVILPPLGHAAFVLSDRFPQTAGRRGSVRFTGTGLFSGLGLRFSPFGTFTSFRFLTSPELP